MKVSLFIALLLAGGVALGPTTAAASGAAATAPEGYPGWIATAGATAKTKCSLSMQGYGDRPGLKSVQLSCTGGTVTALAHKALKKFWGSNLPKQGVIWTEDEECRPTSTGCLLTICGQSDAVFLNTKITAVQTAPGPRSEQGDIALCISQGSRVTLQDCTFKSSSISSLVAYDNTTSVLLDRCSVSNNNITMRPAAEWGVRANNASIVVRSGTFTNNRWQQGSTIAAINHARLAVLNSSFTSNTADKGGALYVKTAQVTINGSHFEANNATWGGAIFVIDQGSVEILPGTPKTEFINNSASAAGGDILATSSAAVNISGALLTGGQASYAGSLQLEGNSTMAIVDTTIQGGRALRDAGCVQLLRNAFLRVTNSRVSGCRAGRRTGGIRLENDARLVLTNSTVSSNVVARDDNGTRESGGGISAWGASRVELQGATIHNNTADSAGALGLYEEATLVVTGPMQTRVFNNTADTVGGGLRLSSTKFNPAQLANLLVVNNSAPYAADISIATTHITVVHDGGADSVIASDSQEAVLWLTLNVSGPHGWPSADLLQYEVFTAKNQRRESSIGSTITEDKLRKLPVRFKHPPGRYRLDIFSVWDESDAASLNITIIPCPKGYVTSGRNDTCNPCPLGLYSFNASEATCSLCPFNAQCPGLDVVWPVVGFWKSAPQSVQTHRCFNRDACIGANMLNGTADNQTATLNPLSDKNITYYKTAQCSEPYQGNLCGQCKHGYGKVRPFHCRKCKSAGAIVVLYLLAGATMIGVVKLLVFFQTAADLSPRTDLQRPIPAEMLRALVIHMQWLYIIGNLDVPLPQSLMYPVQIIGGIWSSTSGSSIGIECILRTTSRVPVAIQKVLIGLFTPAGILLAVLVIEAVLHYLRLRRGKSQAVGHDFASVVMCIVFMFLPTWVSTALSLFTCIPLDTPAEAPYQAEAVGSWWAEDMSQLCYSRSGYHRGWALGLGIPLTLLFCVALPAGVFMFMWFSRKQGKLQDMQFQKHYGFMYRLWRDERCWWESVVLLQTCALVMVSTFGFALGPFYQTMVSAAVLAWIAIALLAVRPFKCPAAGRVAVISVCVLFFTAYACLSFLPYNNAGPGSVYSNIMGAVVLIANIVFLLYAAWLLVQSVNWAAVVAWFSAGCCGSLSNFMAQDGVAGDRGSSAGTLSKVRESAGGPAELPK